MKIAFLFIILFSFACKNQQEGSSSQLDSITIASNGDNTSDGNGGTGIDAISAKEIYNISITNNFPTYTNHMDVSTRDTLWKFRIEFISQEAAQRINHLKFNGDVVSTTGSVGAAYIELEVVLNKSIYLQSFTLNSTKPIPKGMLKSISVFAGENMFYSATNLDDSRAQLYSTTNDIAFTISDTHCASPSQLDYNGQCVQNFIFCSDYNQSGINQFCEIKRDDGQTIFCSPTGSELDCKNKVQNICGLFPDAVQFNAQMFWGEISSQIVQNIQCPK